MALDREDTLKKAEKLLKQGKVSGAIEEYVRLVEDRPTDWNSANALGDLYVRAGDLDRAVEQFRSVADHLFDEGFLPRAAALYKKLLKIRTDDDHAIWRLATIAGHNGVGVDARAYYGRLIKDRRAAGNDRGVTDCVIQLGLLEDADIEARTTSARALVSIGESQRAARVMLGVGELLTKDGRLDEALDALREASQLNPEDPQIRDKLAAAEPPVQHAPVAAVESPPTPAAEGARDELEPSPDIHVLETADHDVVVEMPVEAGVPDSEPKESPEPLLLDSVFEALEAQVNRQSRGSQPEAPDTGTRPLGDQSKAGRGGR